MSKKRANQYEQKKVYVIQSKITEDTLQRLDMIVNKFGFTSRYELFQYLLSAFLRYADPDGESGVTQMDDTIAQIGKIFAGYDKAETRMNIIRPAALASMKLTDAVFVYSGAGSVSIAKTLKDIDTDVTCTCSVNAVLELMMKKLFPEQYAYLQKVAHELDSKSTLLALNYLIEADKRAGEPEPDGYAASTDDDVRASNFIKL